ncbi:hypothetical protein JHK82_053138 [Glycine max]|nr:hypothetical protein JHK86_052986 [Glycine max]KAG5082975.1 hypothetical protein JHK84_053013 [Glycine max]KAG5085741.1 hypothetical protein JHK82_053138 [Glycine max]
MEIPNVNGLNIQDDDGDLEFNIALAPKDMHNLPLGFMSQEVGQSIGNYIGTFLEYDEKNSSNLLRSFRHIRVLMDV